jgi:hypothetical protein
LLRPFWRAAISSVTSILMVGALLTSRFVTDSPVRDRQAVAGMAADEPTDDTLQDNLQIGAGDGDALGDVDGERGDRVDLFGNDVSQAVARYQFDRTGGLYEVHSPRTELPRLIPPKS